MGKELFRKIELFLFDMDGLLFDTESIYINYGKQIAENMGYLFDDSFIEQSTGATNSAFRQMCLDKFGKEFDFDTYCHKVEEYIRIQACNGKIPLMEGAEELLEYLKNNNKKMVLATSAGIEMAKKLTRSKNVDGYFLHMITSENVKFGKPDPEVFLKGAEKAGVDPKKAMVFEDSFNGIRAAHAAGMYPVMIPDKLKPNDEIRKLCHREFVSLSDVIRYFEGEI